MIFALALDESLRSHSPLPAALSVLIGIAGWFYLFYSRAALNLSTLEDQAANRRRIALRRVNGVVILLLAIGIAVGSYGFEDRPQRPSIAFLAVWVAVMALVFTMVILALLDLRLTFKLRSGMRRKKDV